MGLFFGGNCSGRRLKPRQGAKADRPPTRTTVSTQVDTRLQALQR